MDTNGLMLYTICKLLEENAAVFEQCFEEYHQYCGGISSSFVEDIQYYVGIPLVLWTIFSNSEGYHSFCGRFIFSRKGNTNDISHSTEHPPQY